MMALTTMLARENFMLNMGTYLTASQGIQEFTFNDIFLNSSGSGYFGYIKHYYIQQKCEITFLCGGSNIGANVYWTTGQNNTNFFDNPLNPTIGNSMTIICEAGRTYRFYIAGYTYNSSGSMQGTLKKGWYSSNRDDYLDYWNSTFWVNPSWG